MPLTTGDSPTSTLLDRLRDALSADYAVERELGGGGMGTVFLARDRALDRPVAIKVLRPELATAAAAERFQREARLLAGLSHPNVVSVHRAGESVGLAWYAMDCIEAGTLADRLERGPLPVGAALAIACDVLAALEAAHARGIVHRDVKPGNIFLPEGRALLGDFGIAKSPTPGSETLTAPGMWIGTPDYMAPEQIAGREATPGSDLYAVGLVLYEALTGRRWTEWEQPERADWRGVPPRLRPLLRRALALDPATRWPDAAAFRRALQRHAAPARARNALLAAAAVAAVAAAVALVLAGPPGGRGGALTVTLRPFHVEGDAAPVWLGDSLAWALRRALGANTDFVVRIAPGTEASGADASGAAGLELDGTATVAGPSLRAAVTTASRGFPAFRAETTGTVAGWDGVAGGLASRVLMRMWTQGHEPIAADLPVGATPRTIEGLRAFLDAELLFAHAQWTAAFAAYRRAADLDPTCLLCEVRITDVGRWLGLAPDTVRTHRYRDAEASFPPHYRDLIRAGFARHSDRPGVLEDLTTRHRTWGFGWFVRGDEIFHRGPLVGYRRADALPAFRRAASLRPDFAPVWEHLAWASVAEGDSAGAAEALARYGSAASASDPTSAAVGALLTVGFAWRFSPEPAATAFTERMLARPDVAGLAEMAAAPGYFLTLDVPRATVFLGERFARGEPRAGLETSGLLAQAYGLVALGRPDSALALARRAAGRSGEPAIALFAAELPALLALAESTASSAVWPALSGPLQAIADDETGVPAGLRARGAWMLALLARRASQGRIAERWRALVGELTPAGDPLRASLEVDQGPVTHGAFAMALRRSSPLTELDSAGRGGDPFFRALLHLDRAAWRTALRQPEAAVRELRWHENNDFVGYAGSLPQAGEVDYALGTLARWSRARLLETMGPAVAEERCAAYAAVWRHWRDGEPRFAARADTARSRLAALGCPGHP